MQRETCLLWDKTTGEPLHRAIVWQDRRTQSFVISSGSRVMPQKFSIALGLMDEERRQGDRFSPIHPLHPLPIRCHHAIGKSKVASISSRSDRLT